MMGTLRVRIASTWIVASLLSGLFAAGSATAGHHASIDPAIFSSHTANVRVVVQENDASGDAERAVARLGGRVTTLLPIIGGFGATLPVASIERLARIASVRAITLDGPVHVLGTTSPSTPRSVYPKVVRTDALNASGYTGSGVTVALVDTGIASVPDLSGRVLSVTDDITGTTASCENLSGEATCDDTYGHGTFIAGIIAGNGASSLGTWKGAAPGANLVSVKIAGRDGSSDVSTVLAAIQWVVSFKDRYGIKVMNLSLGTNSTQTYRTDPLNYAVERAWSAGITVVVSAGNLGPNAGTISKPADDPWVITVGAIDDRGTNGFGDDAVPNFSARGPTASDGITKPDVVAPGAHIVSLRAVGSSIDTRFPYTIDGAYRKGSGTSMAAGVVSGAVADILQARPAWSPNRVKFALRATARATASSDPNTVGAGLLDANAALGAPAGEANAGLDRSTGLGSLGASRDTVTVQSVTGAVVQGETTAQLLLWDPVAYTTGDWNGWSWYGWSWYGWSWYGWSWYGSTWEGWSWYGSTFNGTADTNGWSWYGWSWYGSAWYGAWENNS